MKCILAPFHYLAVAVSLLVVPLSPILAADAYVYTASRTSQKFLSLAEAESAMKEAMPPPGMDLEVVDVSTDGNGNIIRHYAVPDI